MIFKPLHLTTERSIGDRNWNISGLEKRGVESCAPSYSKVYSQIEYSNSFQVEIQERKIKTSGDEIDHEKAV